MAPRTVIVIGAGLGGLSAGVHAQLAGLKAHLFEHHTAPGGVAACWRRGQYLVDGGIHFMMGHRPGGPIHDLMGDLGIVGSTNFLDLDTYGRFVSERTGRTLTITKDLDALERDLVRLFPDDARIASELHRAARAMQGMTDMGFGDPPELAGALDGIKMMWGMRAQLKYFTGRNAREVREWASTAADEELRWLLENLFLPEMPVWFIFMLLGMLADGQMSLLEGGSVSLVEPIERRLKKLGGDVTYGVTVEKVLVEGDRAVGIRLQDGTEHRADAVISAADGRSTIYGMLGGRYTDPTIDRRYAAWPLVRPLVMATFGVAREFRGEPWLTIYRQRTPLDVGGRSVDAVPERLFNYSGAFAPPGRTVVQCMADTTWDHWATRVKDRPAYAAEKARVAAALLGRLEAHRAGISADVEMTDVATPHTTWRYTLNHQGAWGGFLPPAKDMLRPLPRRLPGLKAFYMAGQWSTPGGSALGSMWSGRQAVQVLCRDIA